MKVGYIGLGNMGGALAKRLQKTHSLCVYDRDPEAVQRLVDSGATACASPKEVAQKCNFVFTCLPTSGHVREVIFGPDGIAAGANGQTMIIDQSTGDPTATRAMASELGARDIQLIDAPVSGGPPGAEAGTIAIMVGASLPQFERVLPIIQAISSNIQHAGDTGNGHVAKIVNNLMAGGHRLLSLEAVALAAKNGMDPQKAVDIILSGSGRNFFMEKFMSSHILTGKLDSGFTLGLYLKDINLACQLGSDSHVSLLMGNLIKEYFQMAANQLGENSQVNDIARLVDRNSGTHLVPPAAQ